ncbi:MAG TPA: hypothetical protein PKH98_02295, partial [Candidatus Omnitrophota bacterium]|nr:hypothetical protein [Candidatus Omnitrophota bacterium]
MFKYYIYKFGQFLASRFPLNVSYRIAIFLSDFQYIFSFRDRRSVTQNLRLILKKDKILKQDIKEVFRNFGIYLMEFLRMDKMLTPDFIEKN